MILRTHAILEQTNEMIGWNNEIGLRTNDFFLWNFVKDLGKMKLYFEVRNSFLCLWLFIKRVGISYIFVLCFKLKAMPEKISIEVKNVENSCFVVMPFSNLYQIEYENIIKPTLEDLNIKCVRGDEIYSKQRIMDDIWESIKRCRFVIAELTGKNPNVLYEVGLAHAIGKPVIILTRNGDDVPFDLKDLRYLFYDVNDPFWGNNLKIGLKNLIEKVIDNPEIDNYLSGITTISKNKFPKINSINKTEVENKLNTSIDVSGNWKGAWDYAGSTHNITINLNQNKNLISGVATINFLHDGEITVVQQIFEGKVNNDRLIIQGVNYTYIERGKTEDYGLDSFDLKFHNEKLIGETYDNEEKNIKIKPGIILEKI